MLTGSHKASKAITTSILSLYLSIILYSSFLFLSSPTPSFIQSPIILQVYVHVSAFLKTQTTNTIIFPSLAQTNIIITFVSLVLFPYFFVFFFMGGEDLRHISLELVMPGALVDALHLLQNFHQLFVFISVHCFLFTFITLVDNFYCITWLVMILFHFYI